VPSSTTFYNQNREPFAFESWDSYVYDFALLIMNANPAFEYQQSSTWSDPIAAFVLNSNDSGPWQSWVIGNATSTFADVLEGGHLQCSSIATYQLHVGYHANSPLYGCGTNKYDTQLMD
jgi:hypothetical protein